MQVLKRQQQQRMFMRWSHVSWLKVVNIFAGKKVISGTLLKWISKLDPEAQKVRDLRKDLVVPEVSPGGKKK